MGSINWNKGLFPAVPIPFDQDGEINQTAMEDYARQMAGESISGVALWVHTGRGLLITSAQREQVFDTWRIALGENKKIICGVGAEYKSDMSEEDYYKEVMKIGEEAKILGADAILVYPPTIFRDKENRVEKIVDYHKKVAELNLPMVLFYLYKAAGGVLYSGEELEQLLSIDQVIGIKMATLDSVCTYQEVSNLINTRFKEISLITGEDRFFGYSMTRGAVGALVGLGAVSPGIQKQMIESYLDKDFDLFIEMMLKVDKLAEAIFINPMEGYIERLLYLLYLQGIIPEDTVNDPFGPGISETEKANIQKVAEELELL